MKNNIQFVRIVSGSNQPDDLTPSIYVDDFHAAYDITEYLIHLGHRSIAFLGGQLAHRSSVERLNGYKAALEHHGIPADQRLILGGDYSFDSGSERTTRLLNLDPTPTAIFACNDEIAAGSLFAARVKQVAVPRDLSIVGFEDSPFSRQSWPRLTTAHQPNTDIAQSAADLLIKTIRATRQEDSQEEALNTGFRPELVVRESSGASPN